ncbi:MAG: glutamate synthase [Planctomycetota bacterium]|nr:MAG: glutamate synthase [Planctomycetota bacterium]
MNPTLPPSSTGRKVPVAVWNELEDRKPSHARVENVDLVVIRYNDQVSVLYGRCLHRGALMADGHVDGHNLICGLHNWDYRYDTGVSEYNNKEVLHKFRAWVEDGQIWVDADEIKAFHDRHPQPFPRDQYLGNYLATHADPAEPWVGEIQRLAAEGLEKTGHHGPSTAMGVSRAELPSWDQLQLLPAQLAQAPLLDEEPVDSSVVLGPGAAKPLHLEMPIFVSDMSFGALSEEAKIALAKGAEAAGTGICSGEGGMLPEEQQANSRYFYELASARFGFRWELLERVQAFHFKGGQAAKTGTGGHLPGHKVTGRIAEVRNLPVGETAISPARFPEFHTPADFKAFADEVRERTGGIPIGFKLSANRIEADLDAALEVGVDYVILDGRGGGTGSAPLLFRDHISVPTLPALARARRHLDRCDAEQVSLVITGGLRLAPDFAKALALGADAIAVSNSALQAIGCQGMRACQSNRCPVGIATQDPELRSRLQVEKSARRLTRYLESTVSLMKVLARACGHSRLQDFCLEDLSTFDRQVAELTGVRFAGV